MHEELENLLACGYAMGYSVYTMVRGTVRGLYTPFFVRTGLDQATDPSEEIMFSMPAMVTQVMTAIISQTVLANYTTSHDLGLQHVALLALTNALDNRRTIADLVSRVRSALAERVNQPISGGGDSTNNPVYPPNGPAPRGT